MKPSFVNWSTFIDISGEKLGPEEYSQQTDNLKWNLIQKFNKKVTSADLGLLERENDWNRLGRPYFKIFPGIAESLKNTKLGFTPEYLHGPFSVFSILLPVGQFPTDNLLVRINDDLSNMKDIERFPNIIKALFCSFKEKDAGIQHIICPLSKDETIEESLFRITNGDLEDAMDFNDYITPPLTTPQQRLELWKLAIATSMFAINKHELLQLDVNQQELEKRFPGGRTKASQKIAVEKRNKEAKKHKGWVLGKEIEVPRSSSAYHQSSGTGTKLTAAHYRSGHMKMQPHGPKNTLRKLIFIPPTLVRPDLPIQESHGFKITGKKL